MLSTSAFRKPSSHGVQWEPVLIYKLSPLVLHKEESGT